MKKVLFVGEKRMSQDCCVSELSPAGYQVLDAKDWKVAIRMAQKERPDCLVVEVEFINLHGLDFIRHILAKSPSLPVILTSPRYEERGEGFRSWSAPAFMVKSSDVAALRETLDQATEKKPSVTA